MLIRNARTALFPINTIPRLDRVPGFRAHAQKKSITDGALTRELQQYRDRTLKLLEADTHITLLHRF